MTLQGSMTKHKHFLLLWLVIICASYKGMAQSIHLGEGIDLVRIPKDQDKKQLPQYQYAIGINAPILGLHVKRIFSAKQGVDVL